MPRRAQCKTVSTLVTPIEQEALKKECYTRKLAGEDISAIANIIYDWIQPKLHELVKKHFDKENVEV